MATRRSPVPGEFDDCDGVRFEPAGMGVLGEVALAAARLGRGRPTLGSVDLVIPVDVYIPGCPPNPHALLHGILVAIGRWPGR